MAKISQAQKDIFISLFQGRQDIYATRWEKSGASGYMPVYDVDWKAYNKHKAQGGNFKNFKDKEYSPLTISAFEQHWSGKEMVGIYPLLADNTSYFIAADFDKSNWQEQISKFVTVCNEFGLLAYVERSRSGNGGHVWLLFDDKYPANKSRSIIFELLRKAAIMSDFDRNGSFDRLFPNQDFHKQLGLGNLIALPLNGKLISSGNTCFLDIKTFTALEDQWAFIQTIQKNPIKKLDKLFEQFFGKIKVATEKESKKKNSSKLQIIIKNQIYLKRSQLPQKVKLFIREHLNFMNANYIINKKMGRSTHKLEMFFKLIEETPREVLLPRGFANELINFCKEEKIDFELDDQRTKLDEISFSAEIELYDYQKRVIDAVVQKDFGVIVAPPSTGKTIISLSLVAKRKQPTLIIVHRKQLFDQWIERIQTFLKIPNHQIGKIGTGKKTIGKKITVAMIQSLKKVATDEKYNVAFGTIIVDECHHIPAKTFRETITHFSSYHLYGVTATPKRKNNDEKLIYVYIGKIIAQVNAKEATHLSSEFKLITRKTNLAIPFNYQTDTYEIVSNVLVFDTARNQLIFKDAKKVVDDGKNILLLSERKSHLEVLNLYLKERFETIVISGEDSERSRKSKLEQIEMGHFQIVLSTGQFLGEGVDIPNFHCLFLVYPFSFEGKLIQYIGRVHRSKQTPVIVDYRDEKVNYFEKLFKKRNRYYNKLRKQGMLIDLN